MRAIRLIFLAGLSFLIAACAGMGTRERPAWVDGESAQHPAQAWLVGRGSAADQARAADRARADLAKIFAVRVQAESSDVQQYGSVNGQGELRQAVERSISTQTDELLRGVEIADYWQEPQTGVWHALAVLSRSRAGQALRQQIAALDDETRGYLARVRSGGGVFPRLALLDRAITLQRARGELNQTLQAVAATGQGMPAPWTVGELEAQRQALLGQIRIAPRGTGEHADSLRAMLGAALSRAGLNVAPQAPYLMTASLDYSALPRSGEWHWVRGVLQVEVSGADGLSHGVRRWEIKESATDAATAERRFVSKVAAILDREAAATLIELAGD